LYQVYLLGSVFIRSVFSSSREESPMTISPPEPGQKVRVVVDKDPVETSFEKWAKPGHFDRTLARGTQNHHLDLEPARRRP
jgi:hypothetical protein